MEVLEFLNHPELWDIVQQNNRVKDNKNEVSYNLFTISSYNSYLENFHSDIIASLLNPIGLHQQGYKFLYLFIEYLNKYYKLNIFINDYKNTIVTRETGRLDIWIRDLNSKQSIIIENKINNATDMVDQIDRYFTYAQDAKKFKVNAVIYLSLDGSKHAPATIENLDDYLRNIGAFTNTENDLVQGWLIPCLKYHGNTDSHSVIHQYIKLIKHLANHKMDTNTIERYYEFLNTPNGFEIGNAVTEMNKKIPAFRAEKFSNEIKSPKPFSSRIRYKENYWLFVNYKVQNSELKLDIWFNNDGSAGVVFWNPSIPEFDGRGLLTEKLQKINLIEEFNAIVRYKKL